LIEHGVLDFEKHAYLLNATHEDVVEKEGVGTELKRLISWFHQPNKKCKCDYRIQKMNKWGPDECEKREATILRWLKHSAAQAKMPYFETAAKVLLRKAIKRSRSRSQQPQEKTAH
jgi:hypothetical protein